MLRYYYLRIFEIVSQISKTLYRCSRIFSLSLDGCRLDLFQELNYHNCCVLQVKMVPDQYGNSILLSTGTNGRLAVWNITLLEEDKAIEPMGSYHIHQSGINSLDCQWVDVNRMLILTGGDDNALICTKVEINCAKNVVELIDQQKQFPHAAQISGQFIPSLEMRENSLVLLTITFYLV